MTLTARILHERLPKFRAGLLALAEASEPVAVRQLFPSMTDPAAREWIRHTMIRLEQAGLVRRVPSGTRAVYYDVPSPEARATLLGLDREGTARLMSGPRRPSALPPPPSETDEDGGGDEPRGAPEEEADVAALLAARLGDLTTAVVSLAERQDESAATLRTLLTMQASDVATTLQALTRDVDARLQNLTCRIDAIDTGTKEALAVHARSTQTDHESLAAALGTRFEMFESAVSARVEEQHALAHAMMKESIALIRDSGLRETLAQIAKAIDAQTKDIVASQTDLSEGFMSSTSDLLAFLRTHIAKEGREGPRSRLQSIPTVFDLAKVKVER